MKYSDQIGEWLVEMGYTTCFFVGGGHCMHLVESLSRKLRGVPVVHEVAAGIAAEYFNVIADGKERALALVTSGPGLTNAVTAIAGAWLEGRELLVLGGQVKTADLCQGKIRQRGLQELCGSEIAAPITVKSTSLLKPVDKTEFARLTQSELMKRKGPVFLEIPLDIQGCPFESQESVILSDQPTRNLSDQEKLSLNQIINDLQKSSRPVILIGGGIERNVAYELADQGRFHNIPVMTTYNGADRVDARLPNYFGRPNTWGMRYSNLLLQQADLVIAFGASLGLQQTGFNWPEFVPNGKVVHINFDPSETAKGYPNIAMGLNIDANIALRYILQGDHNNYDVWLAYCREVKSLLPLSETCNKTDPGYISPYDFYLQLSDVCLEDDIFIPCSSGGAYTVSYQSFQQKKGQFMVSNKGLASMGYGLSGAIGAAIAGQGKRTILVEGDGGFAQNMQELGTVAINRLNMKIFIFDDQGYASIRMTQSNYFGGRYVGCDTNTGLGLPNLDKLFEVWGIPSLRLKPGFTEDPEFQSMFQSAGPQAFIVPIDPTQTYFPKINSRITPEGTMVSNPLHEMSPSLDDETRRKVMKFL
jgi:acetolactate synthase-1/2/3 large subunit